MTHPPAHKWILVLLAIITLGTGTILFASRLRERPNPSLMKRGTPQGSGTHQDQLVSIAPIPAKKRRDPSVPVATYGDARFRFGKWITSLCFSPDGKQLASSSSYWGTVLWDARTGKLIRQFPSDRQWDSQATFSPDGKLLVVTSKHLRVWEVASGKLRYEIKNAGKVVRYNRLVQFTRDGKHFLAVTSNGTALFIETKSGRCVRQIPTGGGLTHINGVALSPDGSRVILGIMRSLSQPEEGVATKAEYAVTTWDLNSGKEILPRKDHFGATLKSIQFSPDGRALVAVTGKGHFNQTFQLLDPHTLKLQRVLKTKGILCAHDFTPDGKLLAVGTNSTRDHFIQLFDAARGKLIRRLRVGTSRSAGELILAVSPDGKTIATARERRSAVTLWDAASGKEKFPHGEGGATTVTRMTILGDGRTVVTRDNRQRVIRRDLKTGRITRDKVWTIPSSFESMSSHAGELFRTDLSRMGNEPRLKGCQLMADVAKHHPRILSEARISADGNRVAVLFRPTRLNIYDRRSGKRLRQFGAPPKLRGPPTVSDMALSADGSRVACYYGPNRQVWNVKAGQKLKDVPGGRYHFAPDGTLAIVGRSSVMLWNVDQGKSVGILDDKPHWIAAVAFSPDGKLMAHARGWGSTEVVLWDLAARRVIRVLRGARGGAAALCFSPDGRKLCAGTNSTLTVVWDLSND